MSIAKRLERFAHDEQRILLDVNNTVMPGNPGVGGGAHVHQQCHRQLAASGAHVHIQPVLDDDTRARVGRGIDVCGNVQFGAVRLTSDPDTERAQPLEPRADPPHEPAMARQRGLGPAWVAKRGCGFAHNRARPAVRTGAEIPLGIRDAGSCWRGRLVPRSSRRLLAGAQDLLCQAGRPDDTRLGQFRERVPQRFRVRLVGSIGRALEAERVLDALLRLVGANDPRPCPLVVFVFRRFPNARPPPHLGDAAALEELATRFFFVGRAGAGRRPGRGVGTAPVPSGRDPAIGARRPILVWLRGRPAERVRGGRAPGHAGKWLQRIVREQIAHSGLHRVGTRVPWPGADPTCERLPPRRAERWTQAPRFARDPVVHGDGIGDQKTIANFGILDSQHDRRAAPGEAHPLLHGEQEVGL